ncbi:hypothetical protein AJ79_04427 [Helicocarpus griseus UAMH5409]|uniref:Uncharacterized protein n=1 Tax=Helicocarpus griseus UAMH5409 TaxID=1447875 RepID=A0A2B7XUT7_9EURO|nr:hypothetical protein AJ79_04427 [Helicocarpus griseus UAMH5409]
MTRQYLVFIVRFTISMPDPDLPTPRYHTTIFVETAANGSGYLHEVTGAVTSMGGMQYQSNPHGRPELLSTFYSRELLGVIDASGYPESFDNVLGQLPPPPRQKAYNPQTNRTEPFKSENPLTFYEDGEPRRRLVKCTEWMLEKAIPALRSAGLIREEAAHQDDVAGPYHPSGQPSGHTLPALSDLTQGASAPPGSHQPPPRYAQHQQPSHAPSHPLPGISQSIQHSPPQQPSLNRERERDSRERDRERERELERHRELAREEEMIHREREYRERERDRDLMERYNREQPHHPVQSHAGPIPIHQPVASKGHNPLGGPNGLLSNLGNASGNPPQGSIPTSNAPGSLFGGQMQHPDGPPRTYLHQGQPPQQSMLGFNGTAPPQIPGSVAALAQGQQPILNTMRGAVISSETTSLACKVNND